MIRVLALLPVAPLGLPLVSSDWARRLCTQPTGAQSEGAQFGLGKLPEMMVCEKEGCETYSLGSGFCVSWMALQGKKLKAAVGTPSWHNCHTESFYTQLQQGNVFQHPPPMLDCPSTVPIAILAVPKAASSSFILWLAQLEGRTEGHLTAALSARSCLELGAGRERRVARCLAKAFYHPFANYSSKLPGLNLKSFGCTRQKANGLASYGLRWHQTLGTGWLVAPPFLCQQCCMQGYGRLMVILARNPYMRIASYFKRWIAPTRFFGDWSMFPIWLRHLQNVSRFTDGFKACRGRGELNSDDVLHTRSVKEMLDDDRVVPGRSHRRFNIIHLETLATWCFRRCALCSFLADAGLLKVENHPKRQNRVHLKNLVKDRMRWRKMWRGLKPLMLERYGWDFEHLGYSTEPWAEDGWTQKVHAWTGVFCWASFHGSCVCQL
ncbi:Pentatricopeptide repeat-containing protein [Durusdinium trenchii]|uniref:Mitochondrial n=1 Tax=Durusdinium trenchii TaxID=1381693 RepID=A0ABP0PLV4_9DINO